MGNKSNGRAVMRLPNPEYLRLMGADVKNILNTGVAFTNYEVLKYFKLLREYALNRVRWKCDQIPEQELRLIEWNIFHYGRCAMLRPKISRQGWKYETPTPRIFQCAYTRVNERTGEPESISIVDKSHLNVAVDVNYNHGEFTIFTDEFLFANNANPFYNVAWEFACKLHELDLAFNANSHRNRMPFVFNNGAMEKAADGTLKVTAIRGPGIAEIMRSAYGRNEQFIEIPEDMVGKDGFMHEPRYVENLMLEHIEAQTKLYKAYFERLGLYTDKEKSGVYTVKKLQEDGDESPDYITEVMKSSRVLCMKRACAMFSLNMSLEVI